MTSVEAARLLGLAASTTRNAAAGGKVKGAYPDTTRTGTIQPPWVATEEAWRTWAANVHPRTKRVAREREETLTMTGTELAALLNRYERQKAEEGVLAASHYGQGLTVAYDPWKDVIQPHIAHIDMGATINLDPHGNGMVLVMKNGDLIEHGNDRDGWRWYVTTHAVCRRT